MYFKRATMKKNWLNGSRCDGTKQKIQCKKETNKNNGICCATLQYNNVMYEFSYFPCLTIFKRQFSVSSPQSNHYFVTLLDIHHALHYSHYTSYNIIPYSLMTLHHILLLNQISSLLHQTQQLLNIPRPITQHLLLTPLLGKSDNILRSINLGIQCTWWHHIR